MSSTQLKKYDLSDTIIEIRFKSDLPQATLGYFHKAFLEIIKVFPDFKFIENAQILNPIPNMANMPVLDQLTYEDKGIRIAITPFTIHFNSIGEYKGWDIYFPKIKKVLEKLHDTGIILAYNRVGVRYITEFKHKNVLDEIKGTIKIEGISNTNLKATQIKTSYQDDGFRINLNIANEFSRTNAEKQSEIFSFIDFDVQSNCQMTDLKDFFNLINITKAKQKDSFYKLVPEQSN